jgi:hypothetical protein
MNKHVLLSFMILCYLLPISYVYYNYSSNNSVSNIICNENCKKYVLFFMIFMGIGTILYELERNDLYSQIAILVLLFGLYSLICIDETYTIHYFFAFLVFFSILFFMIRHCYVKNCDVILSSSLLLEIMLLLFVAINLNNDIFYGEIGYLLNFAFYYLYLHFIQ